jgi:hypothetical protein
MGILVVSAYFMVGAKDPSVTVIGLPFEQRAIANSSIQMTAIACVVIYVYMLGTDFWGRLNGSFE